MSAGTANLTAEQGATFYQKLIIRDAEDALIDLTDDTFRGKVKKNVTDETAVATFAFNILDQVTNKGEVEMTLTAAQTAAITLRKQQVQERTTEDFCYDVERELADGTVQRIMQGKFSVSPEVTR